MFGGYAPVSCTHIPQGYFSSDEMQRPARIRMAYKGIIKWPQQNNKAQKFLRTFVSWWYLPRICPFITDMQYYYHARYPTDDWHLAYMLSLVYFPVEVCLEGVLPHSVSTWRDSCARVYAPLTLPPPLSRKKTPKQNRTGGGGGGQLSTWTKRGGIWTVAWVCLHYWVVIWVAG